jgi:hypothetical protein
MRQTMGRISELCKTEVTSIEVNGKTVPARIVIHTDYDPDYDMSLDDDETIRGLQSGAITPVWTRVTAYAGKLSGEDSMGGILITNKGMADLEAVIGPDCYDMRQNALDALQKAIADTLALFASKEADSA